ncbi:Zn-dependent protease with chaperone function [gamma proteobacterium IMCC1989]|nr:Zn-dependent protease with chaperone function [gamma proteobacterium IMCC1989]
MNFFEHQHSAKKKTTLLVFLLVIAVCCLIAITILAITIFLYFFQSHTTSLQAYQTYTTSLSSHFFHIISSDIFLWVITGVVSVVGIGSLYKLTKLSQGGKYVAESLGGRLLHPNSQDPAEKKILNVVEEMAIASGNPVPSVYLLADNSINAFAAGLSRRDAVIGVTQGCIELLNRDELQGVMAHEFSHIHNGDMRLNMRLIACLHGILVIGLIGSFIIRGSSGYGYSRRRNKNRGQQMILGLALVVIGYSGTFFGNIIKAAVSRQREFLADASAVQFTRNSLGISNALKKIGASNYGSTIHQANASEFSHLFFGEGIKNKFSSLMATHPPLDDRIRRVEPRWNGQYPSINSTSIDSTSIDSTPKTQYNPDSNNTADNNVATNNSAVNYVATPTPNISNPRLAQTKDSIIDKAIDTAGEPSDVTLLISKELIKKIPRRIMTAAHEPFSARALIYCLLIDQDTRIQQQQLKRLQKDATPESYAEVRLLLDDIHRLEKHYRLLLIDLSVPALKLLSAPQYRTFKKNLAQLIKADKAVSLFEWCLYRIVTHTVEVKSHKENRSLRQCQQSIEILLSAVVHHGENPQPNQAFVSGKKILELDNIALLDGYSFKAVDNALNELSQLKPLRKPILLRAIMACINYDGKVNTQEAELFRAIADTLNCPIPPLYSNTLLEGFS